MWTHVLLVSNHTVAILQCKTVIATVKHKSALEILTQLHLLYRCRIKWWNGLSLWIIPEREVDSGQAFLCHQYTHDMKQMCQFFGGWIVFWMLITFIGWFVSNGQDFYDFRQMSGDVVVVCLSSVFGWMIGLCCVSEPSKWFEGEKPWKNRIGR